MTGGRTFKGSLLGYGIRKLKTLIKLLHGKAGRLADVVRDAEAVDCDCDFERPEA